MDFCEKQIFEIEKDFSTSITNGLSEKMVEINCKKYGFNILKKQEKKSPFKKIIKALSEPMLLILVGCFFVTFGISFGQFLKIHDADFTESIGILFAIVLSISITLIMEGGSERAFNALNKIYEKAQVKVIRDGKPLFIFQDQLVVGDIVVICSGDKIFADGRLFYTKMLSINESALTGESMPINKEENILLNSNIALAEKTNCVYAGTFVMSGEGKYIVTKVGDNTEIGKIAKELKRGKEIDTPLQQKLNKLSKTVTIIGSIVAVVVTIISLIKLIITNNFNFSNIQSLFVSCIVLIVASVPEGLPTIVAVSLALNMIKLAKENALIKKMIATETSGAVSVICSDKTGTLTTGEMEVEKICLSDSCILPRKINNSKLIDNFLLNSSAEVVKECGISKYSGNGTEIALLKSIEKSDRRIDIISFRKKYKIVQRKPFDNISKMMSTTVLYEGSMTTLIKGAPEKILPMCSLSESQIISEKKVIEKEQKMARRVLCFAHSENEKMIYDGYVSLIDPIRKEVFKAVSMCKRAGIKIKVLTGDNMLTAYAIAKELGIVSEQNQVIDGKEIEKADEKTLKKILEKVCVISRSTPLVKMNVVESLKKSGEVVALTGDGINDAPAMKHADVGIAMGKNGSDITKETADIVLLDDSFYTIVKAISFGRNVYRNLQRFITFQLSVNFSALFLIFFTAILGYPTPFNTLQLLWINVIMDGPPALTLGLGSCSDALMNNKPVKREKSIITTKMVMLISFNGLFIGGIILMQYLFNFLGVNEVEKSGTVFSLFILFQLFNAFNAIEMGHNSIFSSIGKNKVMVYTFLITFLIHIFIEQVAYSFFAISPLSILTWMKCFMASSSIIVFWEIAKFFDRRIKGKKLIFVNKNKIGA